jgi:hypothetical protein
MERVLQPQWTQRLADYKQLTSTVQRGSLKGNLKMYKDLNENENTAHQNMCDKGEIML